MQTKLLDSIKDTPDGQEAERILRQCVHCGMCNATCPTYQLLGDELDGPRGRIYLIKQVLEGKPVTQKTQLHLDRCLTCLSCETTCPSGVEYGKLLEIGRDVVEKKVGRSWSQNLFRAGLRKVLSEPILFQRGLIWGRKFKSVLPKLLRDKISDATQDSSHPWPQVSHARKVLLLQGCVQPTLAPNINAATARVLDRLQVQALVAHEAGCCGAVRLHLNDREGALHAARRNIDAWWPMLQTSTNELDSDKVESILMTASGCGVTVKDYAQLLQNDPEYAEKAKLISRMTLDLSEFLPQFTAQLIQKIGGDIQQRIGWHAPCTLQHGQKIVGKVETMLRDIGVDVQTCANSHLCCGSAGTYSILQSDLSHRLRADKLKNLAATGAELIVSANMACQQHLQEASATPVMHWIELLDQALLKADAKSKNSVDDSEVDESKPRPDRDTSHTSPSTDVPVEEFRAAEFVALPAVIILPSSMPVQEGLVAAAPVKKSTRKKKPATVKQESSIDENSDAQVPLVGSETAPLVKSEAPKKTTRRSSKKVTPIEQEIVQSGPELLDVTSPQLATDESIVPKPKTSRSSSKKKSKPEKS